MCHVSYRSLFSALSIEPKVSFVSTTYTVQEPLSNFEIDRRCVVLTIRRSGDTSVTSTVAYTTLGDSAVPSVHYVPVNGTIQFEPGEETRNITVPVLASDDSNSINFTVRLKATPPGSTHRPAAIGKRNEANVDIINTPVVGVLFPDLPTVVSLLPDGTFATGDSLYYNAPIVCIDVSIISYTSLCIYTIRIV